MLTRRTLLAASCIAAVSLFACERKTEPAQPAAPTAKPAPAAPQPAKDKKLRVGFAQIGAESDWRRANTESIKAEAAARGIDLIFSDAQQKQENQIKAIRSFVQQGVDAIAFAPVVETGWEPVLKEVKQAGIPVILTDRVVDVSDKSLYVTFIGADFVEEGRRAAAWLGKATDGKAMVAELQGTPGSAPAIDRKKGFEEGIKAFPQIKIIKSQSGEFTRAKGKEVTETFLKSPEGKQITALYSHNDDMALGAIQAIEEAGLKPGVDIKIVSIDGVRAAFEAMVAGKLNCTVECNPLLGPQLFDTVAAVVAKKPVDKRIVTKESVFEQSQAAEAIKTRKY
ncbi:MAG: ABC transporter substrate-binding protein [Planctomycetes bacterium]|nr:ABC transporter substrate-binding protein [Planctomycetota bacterium]